MQGRLGKGLHRALVLANPLCVQIVCHAAFLKQPSLPQHLGPADVCSPPFSPPKSAMMAAQRSQEIPVLKANVNTPDAFPDSVPASTLLCQPQT